MRLIVRRHAPFAEIVIEPKGQLWMMGEQLRDAEGLVAFLNSGNRDVPTTWVVNRIRYPEAEAWYEEIRVDQEAETNVIEAARAIISALAQLRHTRGRHPEYAHIEAIADLSEKEWALIKALEKLPPPEKLDE